MTLIPNERPFRDKTLRNRGSHDVTCYSHSDTSQSLAPGSFNTCFYKMAMILERFSHLPLVSTPTRRFHRLKNEKQEAKR